ILFTSSGDHVLTARTGTFSDSASVTMTDNAVKSQDFAISTPDFEVTPGQIELDVTVNTPTTRTVSIKNVGAGPGTYRLIEVNGAQAGANAASAVMVPGKFTPASVAFARAHNLELGRAADRFAAQAVMPQAPQSSAWEMIANMPVAAADMTA